ncbi:hypothetical protein ACCD10_28830 [Pseudomonas sp. Pseusp122]|uniref:hypothetical protein n=1 Tax=unclassified Pseudomonas TaxID=196821 RepID=UPI0039A76F43
MRKLFRPKRWECSNAFLATEGNCSVIAVFVKTRLVTIQSLERCRSLKMVIEKMLLTLIINANKVLGGFLYFCPTHKLFLLRESDSRTDKK